MKCNGLKLVCLCLVALLLSGCSAERRIARIARKHNITTIKIQTVKDTVVFPGYISTYSLPIGVGGIFYNNDPNISLAGFVRGDTVYIHTRRPADTVYLEKQVPLEVVQMADSNKMPLILRLSVLLFICICVCVCAIMIKILKK